MVKKSNSEVTDLNQFNLSSDQNTIAGLENLSNDDLVKIGALDWTIKERKQTILTYLLETRGISPFSYSVQSSQLLAVDPNFGSILESYQEPLIIKMLTNTLEKNTSDQWDKAFYDLKIQSPACLNIFRKTLSFYFYWNNPASANGIISVSQAEAIATYKSLIGTSTCRDLKQQISSSDLNGWYTSEIRRQYEEKFESSKLIELFETINNVQNISIDAMSGATQIRIDPRLLLFVALPSNKDIEKKKHWLELLNPHISDSPLFYFLRYKDKDPDTHACPANDQLCEEINYPAIGVALNLLTHSSKEDENPDSSKLEYP